MDAMPRPSSPRVTHLEWGHIDVDGRRFRDVKLSPTSAEEWDWRITGTRHVPGASRSSRAASVARYTELRDEEPVGALIHTTC